MFANLDEVIKSDAAACGEQLSPGAKDKRLKAHMGFTSEESSKCSVNHLYFSITETHEECDLCSVDPPQSKLLYWHHLTHIWLIWNITQTPINRIEFPNNAVTPHDLNLEPLAYPQRVLSTLGCKNTDMCGLFSFNYYVLTFDLQGPLSVELRTHELIIYRQPSLRCAAAHIVHCKGSKVRTEMTMDNMLQFTRDLRMSVSHSWRHVKPRVFTSSGSRLSIQISDFLFFFKWQTALNVWDNCRSCCLPLGAEVFRVTALRNGTSTSPQLHRGDGGWQQQRPVWHCNIGDIGESREICFRFLIRVKQQVGFPSMRHRRPSESP